LRHTCPSWIDLTDMVASCGRFQGTGVELCRQLPGRLPKYEEPSASAKHDVVEALTFGHHTVLC
jgi:hypothetical protein